MRSVVLCFTVMVTLFALNSNASIYKMVENAYKVTLVAAFVPLAFGLYWHRATSLGATLAIMLGLATWINLEIMNPNGLVPPQLAGLGMSLAGMIFGSLVSFAGGQKTERTHWFARR
jgi:Na+/proline symporter